MDEIKLNIALERMKYLKDRKLLRLRGAEGLDSTEYDKINKDIVELEIVILLLQDIIEGRFKADAPTFDEIYEHRCLLWINLCLMMPNTSYLTKNHLEDCFLLGNETPWGQISYHCPNKFLSLVNNIKERNVKYDGHNSQDTLKRLVLLTDFIKNPERSKDGSTQ